MMNVSSMKTDDIIKWSIKYPEKMNECRKRWRKNNYSRVLAYTREWRIENPEKYKAQTLAGNALRDKKIKKKKCLFCKNLNTVAHHHDYSKPLDVMWLCRTCHKKIHKHIGRELI